eukprot:CAMPEP_0171108194 /NCGR_PEP_ID=MMETSP0766_2-20121228/68383_1 /TAXON_ID=439317 /ORGANISM="Gambierdiscus australes, Strain CAWD 149" /LENGTH=250 /DNA_ID=CAMNT_0011569649 /DNA_START=19 /DNA_END=769 /DNA_ORIENTATION=+
MKHFSSDPQLILRPRTSAGVTGVPGYTGHIPGQRDIPGQRSTFRSSNAGDKMHGPQNYDNVARCIPGYAGHIPGKATANVLGDTWERTNSRSLSSHLNARDAPRNWSVYAEGRTLLPFAALDSLAEMPLVMKRPSLTAFGAAGLASKHAQDAFRPPQPHGHTGFASTSAGEAQFNAKRFTDFSEKGGACGTRNAELLTRSWQHVKGSSQGHMLLQACASFLFVLKVRLRLLRGAEDEHWCCTVALNTENR